MRTKTHCLLELLLLGGTKKSEPVYTTFLLVVVSSGNHGLLEVRKLFLRLLCYANEVAGSGSTYVYGYCDATYRDGWGRDKTVEFVKNSKFLLSSRALLS